MFEQSGSVKDLISRANHALNYDFCPNYNKYVYWMKHPLVGISTAAFAACLCAVFVSPQLWLMFFGLIFVAFLGLVWPAISIWATRVTIRYEQAWCEEGSPTNVIVEVQNFLPWPAWGISLANGDNTENNLVSFVKAHGLRKTEFHWEFIPLMRGVYPTVPLYLKSAFPFGVWTAKRSANVEGELVVFPRPFEFDGIPDVGEGHSIDEVFSDRKVGDSGDITGTRAFRQGDSLRRVHWSLTARLNRLICCERQAALQSTAYVCLDASRDHHTVGHPDSTLEWSIRIFAGLCRELANNGITVVGMIGNESVPVGSGHVGIRRLLMRLARIPKDGLSQNSSPARQKSPSGLSIHVMTNKSAANQSGLAVVLNTSEFSSQPHLVDMEFADVKSEQFSSTHQIFLNNHQEIRSSLRSQWRRLCNAVS